MTTLWKETGEIFINLSKRDYVEKTYTKEQITNYFVNACKELIPIFEHHNNKYAAEAKIEVEINNLKSEKIYLSWLLDDVAIVLNVLKDPLNIINYDNFVESHYAYLYRYEKHDIWDFDEISCDSFVNAVKKEDEFFKDFVSFKLLKYAKFLSVFINNLYSYLCFYYENLNKKYYFRFEHLVRDTYGHFYFKLSQNPYLLKTDCDLLDLCRRYCQPLEVIKVE